MSIIYLNGDYVEDHAPLISHKDCGFTTGIGIFDSMLTKDGELIYAAEHYERIVHDVAVIIGLSPPYPPACGGEAIAGGEDNFFQTCDIILKKNNLTTGYARIRTTVTGGVVDAPLAPATTSSILIDVAATADPENITPVTCAVIKDFPRIAGCVLENCKRLDYSRSYAARRQAEKLGAAEAILTNTEGNIACGATSNIFIEENGALITPPLNDGVLAGVTRRMILETGPNALSPLPLSPLPSPPPLKKGEGISLGISSPNTSSSLKKGGGLRWGDGVLNNKIIHEESISPTRLKSADKIYLTNSFIGLREVILI